MELAMFSTEPTLLHELIKYALSDKRGPARWHITRVAMYRALERLFAEEDLPEKTCLCVSQSQALAEILGLSSAEKVITSYPHVDMLALPYADSSFDFVISDQVLEHMNGDPFTAMAESMRVLKPGGAGVHTTCFINFLHQLPLDFWRFSEAALELLARSANAVDIKTGGWGNRDAWTYMQLGYRMSKIPEVPGNPVFELARRNDKRWPVTTWVSFRKPK
jgi:SAM-dependent methyltransferase